MDSPQKHFKQNATTQIIVDTMLSFNLSEKKITIFKNPCLKTPANFRFVPFFNQNKTVKFI